MKENKTKKVVALAVAFILVVVCAVGGTLAWLKDSTETITNTFRYGKVDIELAETTGYENGDNSYEYLLSEGSDVEKDPTVTVKGNSEDSYIFVKLDKSENFDNYLSYTVDSAWTPLDGEEGVYYLTYTKNADDTDYAVLKDNKVSVNDGVTNAELEALTDLPTLNVTAYAVQAKNEEGIFTVEEAWNLINQ